MPIPIPSKDLPQCCSDLKGRCNLLTLNLEAFSESAFSEVMEVAASKEEAVAMEVSGPMVGVKVVAVQVLRLMDLCRHCELHVCSLLLKDLRLLFFFGHQQLGSQNEDYRLQA